jgi:hypothetical protein
MPQVGFEATIPASARSQRCALDRAAAGISHVHMYGDYFINKRSGKLPCILNTHRRRRSQNHCDNQLNKM